jgi:hypothetical protein
MTAVNYSKSKGVTESFIRRTVEVAVQTHDGGRIDAHEVAG